MTPDSIYHIASGDNTVPDLGDCYTEHLQRVIILPVKTSDVQDPEKSA